ncbi:MAG: DUF1552 domain-containing protein [Planctomycetia bacterium]|nr:DUF1552 domain-containing protein [Planctomycetia bacterium]
MLNGAPRRRFLQSAGTLLALPVLESLGFRRFARAAAASPPKRMVFLGFGYGGAEETWFPKVADVGAAYTLPEGLAPLARHKADFTIVHGCANKALTEAHWGSTFWLTGANNFAVAGQSFHNTVSADQVAAASLGRMTPPGLPGPNSWPGYVRRTARTAARHSRPWPADRLGRARAGR